MVAKLTVRQHFLKGWWIFKRKDEKLEVIFIDVY